MPIQSCLEELSQGGQVHTWRTLTDQVGIGNTTDKAPDFQILRASDRPKSNADRTMDAAPSLKGDLDKSKQLYGSIQRQVMP